MFIEINMLKSVSYYEMRKTPDLLKQVRNLKSIYRKQQLDES